MMEHMEEGHWFLADGQQNSIQELVVFREVVDIGPEEKPPTRLRVGGRAEQEL